VWVSNQVRSSTPWHRVWATDFWGGHIASPNSHKSYRPLTVLSFRLDESLYGLEDPHSAAGFRITGSALHAGVTLLVVHLARHGGGPNDYYNAVSTLIHAISVLLQRSLQSLGGFMASIICLLAAVVSRESGVATGAVLLLLEAYTECLPGKRKQEEGRVVVVDGPTILVEAVDPRTVPVAGLKEAPKPGKASKLGSMDLLGAVLGEASREPLAEGTGSCWEEAATTSGRNGRRTWKRWLQWKRSTKPEAVPSDADPLHEGAQRNPARALRRSCCLRDLSGGSRRIGAGT